jgi:hypothetical protein
MRLYFHLENGRSVILDKQGLDVPAVSDLRPIVARALGELAAEGRLPAELRGWRLHIVDECYRAVVSVDLRDDVLSPGTRSLN